MALPLGRQGPAHPVDNNGEDDDHQPGQQRLAELRLAHGQQHLPADILEAADHGRDDHHRKRRHQTLVHANHDLGGRGRDLNQEQLLPAGAAAHDRGFLDFRLHPFEPQDYIARHRRRRINRRGDQPHDRAETEEQKERREIGKCRHGLHDVEHNLHCTLHGWHLVGQDANRKSRAQRQRHRNGHQRERVHALDPIARGQYEA